MAEAGSGASGGYVAFISYSHKDAGAGRWLHRKLEGYRLPRRLAGTKGEDGEVPARLTPIFRDRDELPAAGDLSERVRAALAVSRNLIVICSPHSAASPWVAKEIVTFRELHPDRPIFTAIIEGEPEQCFSPALLEGGTEPLAADLRKEGDGQRLGLLKLVAGMAGVGLDALVQRDAARRLRRVTYVTAAAVAGMLVMAIMTTVAVTSRREAQLQRSQAEGLVEFMLTDLRDKLREVGRLDVHATVNHRAIAYYAAQGDLRRLSDDSLERRARILQAMGEDDEKAGRAAVALARFREAHAVTSEIVARHPDDPSAIYAHAQSEYWLGYMAYLNEDWPRAEARWRGYKALADRLMQIDPANPTSLREQGYATGNLCTLEVDRKGNSANALKACSSAVRTMEQIVVRNPTERKPVQDLGNRYAWLGGAWAAAGRPDRALAEFQKQEHLLAPLIQRFPKDANLQDQWMRALMTTAEHLHKMGRDGEAIGYNQRARRVAGALTAHDPSNKRWKTWIERIDRFPETTEKEQVDG
jgi:tetratricopeptide (TPR) repeat protein